MQTDLTSKEIITQADAWNDALNTLLARQDDVAQLWQQGDYGYIVYTGCGSTYYLALAAASFAQTSVGIPARGVPASELLLHAGSIYPETGRPLLVSISRSAATTETVRATRAFRQHYQGDVVVISCYEDKPLNAEATLTLAAQAGQEQSVVQTRSFSAMLVMAEGLARIFAGNQVPPDWLYGDNEELVQQAGKLAEKLADPERFDRYYYLGSGPLYGLASEAMLKMKEMSLTDAEAYHPMEFRHGPKSMVDERTLVVGLLSEEGYAEEKAVLDEMRELGATTLTLAARDDADFPLASQYPLVRYLPLLQWMAYHRAVKKTLDPDHPRHLEQVVQL